VFVKKSYLSSWVFTAMQSIHIRMNSSLIPPKKKPASACDYVVMKVAGCLANQFGRSHGRLVFEFSKDALKYFQEGNVILCTRGSVSTN